MASRSPPWTAEEEELMEAAIAKTKPGDTIDWFSVAEAVGGGRTALEVELHFDIMAKLYPPFIPTPKISRASEPSQDTVSNARKEGSTVSNARKEGSTHGGDGNGNGGSDGNGNGNGNGGSDGNGNGNGSGNGNHSGNGNGNGGDIGDYGSDHASTSKLHTGNTTESSSDGNVLSGDESDNAGSFRYRLK